MKARDVMTSPPITVTADARVSEIAALLIERRISAVPVVDGDGRIAGIVSEGDLLRRAENATERQRSPVAHPLGGTLDKFQPKPCAGDRQRRKPV